MSGSLFTPKVYQPEKVIETITSTRRSVDSITTIIVTIQQSLVIGLIFLLPVFFIPGLPASLGFDKVMLTLVIGLGVVILAGLASLRQTSVSTIIPRPLLVFWVFVGVAFISGLLSGDIQDSLRGSVFEPQTAGFLALLALTMTIPLVFQRSKNMSLKAVVALGAASAVAIAYTLIRLFLSDGVLSFASFPTVTTSPVGSFNDIAILAALTIIVSLVTLLQLPLKKAYQVTLFVLILAAIAVLAVVNFFNLWLVIGFFGLLLLVYIFSRDTLFAKTGEAKTPIAPLVILSTLVVCIVSILFVVAGDYLGTRLNALTHVNYVEVRPSITATIDIARGVYGSDILLGAGPNRFSDAWKLHKDISINETIFWNTSFGAGFGFIPTLFVTMGILGGVIILLFHGTYLFMGYKMLLKSDSTDSFWYYFGVVTFLSAVFLWGVSYVYVSGPVILLLAALFTGLSCVAYQSLLPLESTAIQLVSSRRRGFFLMTLVIAVITASVGTVFTVGKQYVAQAEFNRARTEATTIEDFQRMTLHAFDTYHDDTFASAMAQSKLAILQSMLSIENPSKEEQEKFVGIAVQAVSDADTAIALDPHNPDTHALLANILIVLAGVGFDDAENRAHGKLEDAKWRDPLNPSYAMLAAYMAVRLNDTEQARAKIADALALKRNFSEALLLLTQLDVKEGNLESAIETTRQMITLEPNNPSRFYQLGVLLSSNKDIEGAITAYEAAITRDKAFANARYMLALSYLDAKRLEDALTQLRVVRETNKDNQELQNLIAQLETNGLPLVPAAGLEGSVNETAPTQEGAAVTTSSDPNTTLVTPVNTVSGGNQEGQQ